MEATPGKIPSGQERLTLSLVPPGIVLVLWRGAPPTTVREILSAPNTPKEGRKVFTGKTHMPSPTKAIFTTNVNLINNAKWAYAMIKKSFDENGIKFAFPTVQIAGGGEGAPAAAAAAQAAGALGKS